MMRICKPVIAKLKVSSHSEFDFDFATGPNVAQTMQVVVCVYTGFVWDWDIRELLR